MMNYSKPDIIFVGSAFRVIQGFKNCVLVDSVAGEIVVGIPVPAYELDD